MMSPDARRPAGTGSTNAGAVLPHERGAVEGQVRRDEKLDVAAEAGLGARFDAVLRAAGAVEDQRRRGAGAGLGAQQPGAAQCGQPFDRAREGG